MRCEKREGVSSGRKNGHRHCKFKRKTNVSITVPPCTVGFNLIETIKGNVRDKTAVNAISL